MHIYPIPGFTEPFSSITHLLGAGVFAALTYPLLRRGRGSKLRVAALAVYSFTCIFLLSMSGVYHLLDLEGPARAVLARLDHAAIFAFIAGTFTPVYIILFRGWRRWDMLLLVWSAAIAGLTLKSVFFTSISHWVGLSFYLVMGWLGAISCYALWRRFGLAYISLLIAGGLAYTAGALIDFLNWPALLPGVIGAHELFHIFVLLGVGLHWRFVWRIAPGVENG